MDIWLLILGMLAITFITRYSLFAFPDLRFPPLIRQGLHYVPTAVLTAIVVPGMLMPDGQSGCSAGATPTCWQVWRPLLSRRSRGTCWRPSVGDCWCSFCCAGRSGSYRSEWRVPWLCVGCVARTRQIPPYSQCAWRTLPGRIAGSPLHQRADLELALAQAQVLFVCLEQQRLVVDAQFFMSMTFGLAAVEAFTGAAAQALVALLAWFHLEAEHVDIGDLHLITLPGLQRTALQGWGVDEGRGREHDMLALLQIGTRYAIEQPVAAQMMLLPLMTCMRWLVA